MAILIQTSTSNIDGKKIDGDDFIDVEFVINTVLKETSGFLNDDNVPRFILPVECKFCRTFRDSLKEEAFQVKGRMWIVVNICATRPIVLEDKSGQITWCRSVIHFILTLAQSINFVTPWCAHTSGM